MHELSLACAMVAEVERICTEQNAVSVAAVTITIGTCAGVDPAAFEFALPTAVDGTRLQDARLIVREVPARVRCRACGAETCPRFPVLVCGCCNSPEVAVSEGRDLLIQSVELTT